MKSLISKDYEPIPIDDFQGYIVKLDLYKKYGDILKKFYSVIYTL